MILPGIYLWPGLRGQEGKRGWKSGLAGEGAFSYFASYAADHVAPSARE